MLILNRSCSFYQKKLSLVCLTHGSKAGGRLLKDTDFPSLQGSPVFLIDSDVRLEVRKL